MTDETRESLIPATGTISQTERMFRVNWVSNITRSPSGVPLLRPDFVAKQGRKVRLIDVRDENELIGVLGYINGSDWVPKDDAMTLLERVHRDDPIVFVSAGEERSGAVALALEKAGLRFVGCMMGGIVAWRDDGYTTTRDPSIVARRNVVRSIEEPPDDNPDEVTAEEIERHVGDPLAVRWIKLPALLVRGLISCVDGRDDSGVIGSPGGDAGELLVGLRALENLMRRELSESDVDTLMARRNDVFGRFYMHTDMTAVNAAIKVLRADRRFDQALVGVTDPLEWREFWASPPPQVQSAMLDMALDPAHIGCGHLRLELTKPQDYATREPLVRSVLRCFHRHRWEGHPDMELVPLAGGHTERAVVNVRLAGPLQPFSRIPLVSPAVGAAQVFVHHPRITSYLRRQLASFLALQTDITRSSIDAEWLHEEMVRIGAIQISQTLGALAKGLPIYDVVFHGEDRVEVRHGGVVGD
jgi:rhodanese-related sulfurtransferase